MKGFIVYTTHRLVNDRAYVTLFGRLENGESFVTMNYFRPYFYIKASDLKKAQKIDNFEFEKCDMKTFGDENVVKIILDLPGELKEIRKELSDYGITSFEADIKFPQRFLMDKDIQGAIEIEGEHESGEYVDRVYKEPEISKTDYWPNLKVLSFDIETNCETEEINCLSLVQDGEKATYLLGSKKIKGVTNCETEEELLENFLEKIRELDPDIITGWNVIDFDWATIAGKLKKYRISLNIGRDNTSCKLRIESDFFKTSKMDVPGRMVLDGLALIKASFLKFDNYKLDTVAQGILGEKKLIQFENKGQELNDLFEKDTKKYAEYNQKDAQLVLDILDKSSVLNFTIKRSILTGLTMDRVSASIAALDSLYIRKANKKGLVAPSHFYTTKERGILGGFVKESEPGIYDNIIVMDFKSLYPSLMRTFNIDPASYVESGKGKNLVKAPNGACFKNQDGIMPEILTELWAAREETRKQKDEMQRYAIKILMNSFFGALASPNSRFFNMEVANSITHYAQHFIKLTIQIIEKKGYKVIYGDTDSIFLLSEEKDYNKALNIGEKLEKEINEHYDKFIKKEYKRDSHLELEFEKCYIKFMMQKVRGGEKGAKKRYAGLLEKDGKETVDITGLEAVRGDWTELAKQFQRKLLDLVFHDKSIEEYIIQFVEELKQGKHDELLIYRKQIRKGLDEYTKINPPHVKAARKLEHLDSNIIEYVLTTDGPEPIQQIRNSLDYEHYIKKQLKPVAESILELLDKTFDDVVKGSTQTTLGGF